MRRNKRCWPGFGTISHGTMRTYDLVCEFRWELRQYKPRLSGHVCRDVPRSAWENEDHPYWDSEDAGYTLEELFDAMNSLAPEYVYFGASEGDGSDYGFWLNHEAIDEALSCGDIIDYDKMPTGYSGLALQTSDHGNMSLYNVSRGRTTREVWGAV
jgi:hypothetical protein